MNIIYEHLTYKYTNRVMGPVENVKTTAYTMWGEMQNCQEVGILSNAVIE